MGYFADWANYYGIDEQFIVAVLISSALESIMITAIDAVYSRISYLNQYTGALKIVLRSILIIIITYMMFMFNKND